MPVTNQWIQSEMNTDKNRRNLIIVGLPAFRDNRIWVIRDGKKAVIVDPGEAVPVMDFLKIHEMTLAAVLLTHHHADHVGGAATLANAFPGCPVFGPAAESITGVSEPLSGSEAIDLLGARWAVMAVPGHTRGHLAYYMTGTEGEGSLFCGDVLFGLGCGRLFEGTAEQMAQAMADFSALPDSTRIYCAHEYTVLNLPFAQKVMPENLALQQRALSLDETDGPVSTLPLLLAEEKATNPFLRCADPEVMAAAAFRSGTNKNLSPVEVFAILRAWRDLY